MQGAFGRCAYPLDHYEEQIAALADPGSVEMNEVIPADLRDGFRPILLGLLQSDPSRRSSVRELLENRWLMKEEID